MDGTFLSFFIDVVSMMNHDGLHMSMNKARTSYVCTHRKAAVPSDFCDHHVTSPTFSNPATLDENSELEEKIYFGGNLVRKRQLETVSSGYYPMTISTPTLAFDA